MAVDSHAMLHGGIAQLGERLNGIQEVRGSTPLISMIFWTPMHTGWCPFSFAMQSENPYTKRNAIRGGAEYGSVGRIYTG